ncbi:MAG: alkaline phosphatase [Fervidobacterium sp.]
MKKLLAVTISILFVYFAFGLNVIFLVPDGMSTSQLFLASILEGKVLTTMTLPYTGIVTTYSADSWVTDSAPAATAFFSGFKTLNKAIGTLPNGESIESIFELAKKAGYKIGIAVTCQITHATPAAVFAHVSNRNDELTIAKQFVESEVVDVAFGGGWQWFLPEVKGGVRKDGLDLIKQLTDKGYKYINNVEELTKLSAKTDKVVGLFAKNPLDPVAERSSQQPTLDLMTKKALEILSESGKPFMLMVEGSQIDWECHNNDFYGVWKEVIEFDNAVKVAIEFAKKDGNTLVIVAGDHETGGLSLSAGGYTINVEQARQARGTAQMFLKEYKIDNKESFVKGLKDWYGITMTDAEYETLKKVPEKNLRRELSRYISFKLGFGWTAYDHTAQPVVIYAYGPGANYFTGVMDNTDVAKLILKLTNLKTIAFPKVSSTTGY